MLINRRAFAVAALVVPMLLAQDAWAAKRDNRPPSSPARVNVKAATSSTLSLAWRPSTDDNGVAGYVVTLSDRVVARTIAPSVTLVRRSCGRSYDVKVFALDRRGMRSKGASGTFATAACPDNVPPTSPAGFVQTFTTSSSAVVEWTPARDKVGVVSYGIYSSGIRVGETAEPRFVFTDLQCGELYTYGIDAADAMGNRSADSLVVIWVAECPDTVRPTTPAPLVVTGSGPTTVTLAWPPSDDDVGIHHYDIYQDGVEVLEATDTTATLKALGCGKTYEFGVVARDRAGNASAVASVNGQTGACAVPSGGTSDTSAPSAPGGLGATGADQTTIGLAWLPAKDNVGVTSYTIFRDGVPASQSAGTSSTLTGLTCGTAYFVEVSASDAAGNRSRSTGVYLSTTPCADTTAPSAPPSVSMASRTQTSISITWTAGSDNVSVAGYGVYRAGSRVAVVADQAYTFAGLACGTNHSLGVDANDGSGNRSTINTILVATEPCADTSPPSAPTNLAASAVTQTGLTLTWSASTDNAGVRHYVVTRNGAQIAAQVTSTSYAVSSLTCATTSTFGVEAVDAAGNRSTRPTLQVATSACSTPPSTTPPPLPPPPPTPPPAPTPTPTGAINVAQAYGTNDSAIRRAVAAAKAAGKSLYFPSGTYDYTGFLILEGVSVAGDGAGSVLRASDPNNSAIILRGSDVSIRSLKVTSPNASSRVGPYNAAGVYVDRADRFTVDNVTVEKVQNIGIVVYKSGHGTVTNNYVTGSLADAIHLTGGTHDVEVKNNRVRDVGDDMIAVVSYLSDAQSYNIVITDNDVRGQWWGRGISVVGGRNVRIERNTIAATAGAGILVNSDGSFGTHGTDGVQILNNTISDTANHQDIHHGGIHVQGWPGQLVLNTTVSDNTITDAGYRGIVVGPETRSTRINANRVSSSVQEGIFVWGANDASITGNQVERTGVYGVYTTRNTTGRLEVLDNTLRDVNTNRASAIDVIHVEAGSGVSGGEIRRNSYSAAAGGVIDRLVECANTQITVAENRMT